MAIPAKNLQAFAGGDSPAGGPPAGGNTPPADSGADKSKGEGGGEESKPESTRFLKLLPLLIEHGKDIEACCDELDPDVLTDPEKPLEEDQAEMFKDSLEGLDSDLLASMKDAFKGGIDQDEAEALAEHMVDSEAVDDAEPVAGWLFRAAKELGEPGSQDAPDPDADEDDDTSEEGDTDDDYSGMGD